MIIERTGEGVNPPRARPRPRLRYVYRHLPLTERQLATRAAERVDARVREDARSGIDSGARATPTFFIDGRRYEGAWDERPGRGLAAVGRTPQAGAGALAGIGFTMSLFIAGQAFPNAADFAAAKVAIYLASLISGVAGLLILWRRGGERGGAPDGDPIRSGRSAGETPSGRT